MKSKKDEYIDKLKAQNAELLHLLSEERKTSFHCKMMLMEYRYRGLEEKTIDPPLAGYVLQSRDVKPNFDRKVTNPSPNTEAVSFSETIEITEKWIRKEKPEVMV